MPKKKKEIKLHESIAKVYSFCQSEYGKLHIMKFDNVTDLQNVLTLNQNEIYNDFRSNTSDSKKLADFNEFENLQDSINAMVYGYDVAVEKLNHALNDDDFRIDQIKPKTEWSVAGNQFSVARAIAGHPKSMKRQNKVKVPKKEITLVKNISLPCDVKNSEIIETGKKVCQLILALEELNFNVRLMLIENITDSGSGKNKNIFFNVFKIKDFNESFNLMKYGFYLVSPDFLRRINLKINEVSPVFVGSSYGCPINNSVTIRNSLEKYVFRNNEEFVLLPSLLNKNKSIEDLIKEFF